MRAATALAAAWLATCVAGAWAEQRHGLTVVNKYALPHGATLYVATGNIVKFTGNAIVNAANEVCLGGGGVDGAISSAGGPALLAAREQLPIEGGVRCPVGDAKITSGGDLPASFCIHAVGPDYRECDDAKACDGLLTTAYESALRRAEEEKLSTIAFTMISCGIFHGSESPERLQRIGMKGIHDAAYAGLQDVYVVAYPADVALGIERACQSAGLKPAGRELMLAGAAPAWAWDAEAQPVQPEAKWQQQQQQDSTVVASGSSEAARPYPRGLAATAAAVAFAALAAIGMQRARWGVSTREGEELLAE